MKIKVGDEVVVGKLIGDDTEDVKNFLGCIGIVERLVDLPEEEYPVHVRFSDGAINWFSIDELRVPNKLERALK